MNNLRQELRVALRGLFRSPAFTISAVLTLALGIGASTSVFSVAYGILLSPIPVRDPSRLVVLWGHNPSNQPEHFPLWGEEYKAFARETRTLSQTAAYSYQGAIGRSFQIGDTAMMVRNALVSGSFFDVLGVRPRLGRLLRPGDDVFGTQRVVVISEGLWQRTFGGDSTVIGKAAILFAKPVTIVGVVPRGMDVPAGTEVWAPSRAPYANSNGDTLPGFWDVVGRLAPGATPSQAAAELGAFLSRADEPHSGARMTIGNTLIPIARPLTDVLVGDVRPAIRIVVGSVALVLLVTCINIANLQLIRAVGRRRELAVRAALGASRARIARHVLVESSLIALAGAMLGILFAKLAVGVFLATAPATLPRLAQVGANAPVLVATIVLGVGVAIIVGVLPALASGRLSLADNLRERSGGSSATTHRTRSLLVTVQVAVAVAVLVAAGVVVHSFERIIRLDLGFTAEHLFLARMGGTPQARSIDTIKSVNGRVLASINVTEHIAERVRALPGVSSATLLVAAPFQATGLDIAYSLPGQSLQSMAGRAFVNGEGADGEYFRTMGIAIVRGRAFTAEDDDEHAARVAIVDEALARAAWPGQDPIGKQIGLAADMHTVIGVAGPSRYRGFLEPRQTLYVPYRQTTSPSFVGFGPSYIAIRTSGNQQGLIASVRNAVRDANEGILISDVTSVDDLITSATAQPRLDALLLAGFAVSILLLTALGLYSIAATYVRHRELEIAVRIALGATPGEVTKLVLGQGVRVVASGALVGATVAMLGGGVLGSIVYGVRARDPLMIALALAGVGAAALLAFLLPARRASRANPAEVLRAG